MDCFYAAVEMRDNPEYRDLPLAVGGRPDQRGVVATCNYAARKFGIHSAMATAYALKLCPQLLVIPPRMSHYQSISRQIRDIFYRYTEIIEPLSLDEAYLDVSTSSMFSSSATLIAEDIRKTIKRELNLTASAGVASNKFLAKICSDENKPDGQFVVPPDKIAQFVQRLPLEKIPGVGKVTLKRLHGLDLRDCSDVRAYGEQELVRQFGSLGKGLYQRAQGIDERPLNTQWIRKSVSVERTFAKDIQKQEQALPALESLFEELQERLIKHQGRVIKNQQIKLKFANFRQTTMDKACLAPSANTYKEMLPLAWARGNGEGIRLLGIGVSFKDKASLEEELQLDLF